MVCAQTPRLLSWSWSFFYELVNIKSDCPLLLLFLSELDWDVGQPNGGETQNFVSFKVTGGGEKSFLGDEIENIKQCAYCSVSGNNNYTSYPLSLN